MPPIKMPPIVFHSHWGNLLCYNHLTDPENLELLLGELETVGNEEFWHTLDGLCCRAAWSLRLAAPLILHRVAEMIWELRFASRDINYLMDRISTFQIFAKTAAAAEKLRNKARLWEKSLAVNI